MPRMLMRSRPAELTPITPVAYRADIDGLRAVSILAVVWYHAFPGLVPGGFVGVDIFFVISGFLITRIIARELAADSFSILSFYQRRIRRIFPALIVVLAMTYVAGWLVLLPRDFALLGTGMAGGAGFFANLVQLGRQDYFAPDASTNPLLHLWSLGIEEQFYIFWPILLIFLRSRRFDTIVIVALAALSMAANLILVADHQAIAFYSPITRAWELLAGALLAQSSIRDTACFRIVSDDAKATVGLLLIALAIGRLDSSSRYPGWNALLPVCGAVLLLDARASMLNRRVLSHRVMVFIGLVSYPLYLWHWPILTYLGILRAGVPNALEKDLAVVLSFILACGTYYLVEQPVKKHRHAVIGLCTAMVSIGAVGLFTVLGSGFGFRFPTAVRDIANLPGKENSGFRQDCFLEAGQVSAERQTQCIEDGSGPLIFVWGDSTAAALYPGLKASQQQQPFRIAQFTAAACPPIVGVGGVFQCASLNRETFNVIRETKPAIVLLHAMWNEKTDLSALRETIANLRHEGIARIIIVGPVPLWKRSLPFMLINAYRFQHYLPDRIASGVSGPAVDERMAQFAGDEHVEYFSAWRQFCNSDGCMTRDGPSATNVVVLDQLHLSTEGSKLLSGAIVKYLFGH
jgi:peptidoglycan/LPS O-acetylase OafA/YrhL